MKTKNVGHAISRRDLIKIGSIGAIGTASIALGGCGAPASSSVGKESSAKQSLDGIPSFMNAPDPIAEKDIVETKDYDVVVVGAGTAGVPAAISAHVNGASVAVVQKESKPISQGNTAAGIALDKSDDAAIEWLIDSVLKENQYRADREQMRTWARNSGEALDFISEYGKDGEHPAALSINDRYPDGYVAQQYPGTNLKVTTFSMRCGVKPICWQDGIESLAAIAAEDGVEFFYSTPAVQLVQSEEGSITGVICEGEKGYMQFNASKGVVLATGDYQNDEEMVSYYLPDVSMLDKKQMNKTGDGHKMAMWVGGQMEPIGHTKMVHDFDATPMFNEPFLCVDLEGNRFCNEAIDMSLKNNFILRNSHPGHYCQIFDSTYVDQVKEWGGRPTDPEALRMYMPEEDVAERKGVREDRIAVYKADTIGELAEKLGIEDAAALEQTVEAYNALAQQGADSNFGKEAKYVKSIVRPPFYGAHLQVRVSAITSGIVVDKDLRVLDGDGEPIKGLFAAGNTAGRFFGGVDYPLDIAGLSVGRAITGGYVAGKIAAQS